MSKLFNKIVLLAEDNKVNRIVSSNEIEVSCYERNMPDDLHMNFSYAPGKNGHFGQSIHVWKGQQLLYTGARNGHFLKENSRGDGWEKAIESLLHKTIINKILG